MNYCNIKNRDIANGTGVRVTLFVSGCTHYCKGCFNSEAWDFDYGQPFTEKTQNELLEMLKPSFVNGLTLLGGEPFEPQNQAALVPFLEKVREIYPQKDIWCFTGYTFETDLLKDSRARCSVTDKFLSLIDILVDGEFIEELKDITLVFRGSSNQRIIDVKKSLKCGKTVFWEKFEKGV